MMRNKLRWLLPVVLVGSFAATPAIFAQGPNGTASTANRVDRRQDRRALRHQARQVVRQQKKLRSTVRRYGSNSTQARIQRRQLNRSKHQFNRQARHLRIERRQALRR